MLWCCDPVSESWWADCDTFTSSPALSSVVIAIQGRQVHRATRRILAARLKRFFFFFKPWDLEILPLSRFQSTVEIHWGLIVAGECWLSCVL